MPDHAADQPIGRFGLGQPARVDSGIGRRAEPRLRGAAPVEPLKKMFRINVPVASADQSRNFSTI
jgi:hypothetical protein